MKILYGTARSVNDELPYSGLGSLDSYDSSILFELNNRDQYDSYTLWSDHIRNQYANYWELYEKYKLTDNWSGHQIAHLQSFFSDLVGHDVLLQKITITIDGRGYNNYCIIVKDK